jgi:DNA mismatch endonuclease (patch repair protein)
MSIQARTDRHTVEQRRRNMQAVRSRDSKIELLLRKALWRQGVRYRLHNRGVVGNPDIVIKKYRLVVFVDSEFWHGKDWNERKGDIKSNHEFWYTKIEANIKRDEFVNDELKKQGWTVLRYWGKDIMRDADKIALMIREYVSKVRQ